MKYLNLLIIGILTYCLCYSIQIGFTLGIVLSVIGIYTYMSKYRSCNGR